MAAYASPRNLLVSSRLHLKKKIVSGTTIANGKYVLGAALGHGGSAHVFRAHRSTDDQPLAAKIVPISDVENPPALLARYEQVARLDHPCILPILDVGISRDVLFVISPLAEEGNLRQALQHGLVHRRLAVELIVHIADALQYVHERGLVHLDVKPANILLTRGLHPLLGDFGLIQPAPNPTGRARVRGTPAYMAPEQCTLGPTGPAIDQYALGITSFELLTGRRPFSAESPDELLRRQVLEPPPLPTTVSAELPPDLDRVLMKALSKNPHERFPTVRAFALRLASVMTRASSATVMRPQTPIDDQPTLEVVTIELRPGISGRRL
jgi:eukaryotic-like serine/threonine-protein kinase